MQAAVRLLNLRFRCRVSLFHNRNAGDSASLAWIRELIETSGHELVRVFDREAAIRRADRRAHGVRRGGRRRRDRSLCRAPAGRPSHSGCHSAGGDRQQHRADTARRRLERTAGRVMGYGRAVPLRSRVGSRAWGERRFLEGVGIGLVPATIASIQARPLDGEDVASKLELRRRVTARSCLSWSRAAPRSRSGRPRDHRRLHRRRSTEHALGRAEPGAVSRCRPFGWILLGRYCGGGTPRRTGPLPSGPTEGREGRCRSLPSARVKSRSRACSTPTSMTRSYAPPSRADRDRARATRRRIPCVLRGGGGGGRAEGEQ